MKNVFQCSWQSLLEAVLNAKETVENKNSFIDTIRDFLKGRRYNTTENAWIGKKSFSEFGMNEDEIVSEIVSEINDIVELFRKTIC